MALFGFIYNGNTYDVEKVEGHTAYTVYQRGGDSVWIEAEAIGMEPTLLVDHIILLQAMIKRAINVERLKNIGMTEVETLGKMLEDMAVALMN